MTLLAFPGCADLAVIMTAPLKNILVHVNIADSAQPRPVLAHVRIAESAQPRKASNVTRPFPVLWVGSGDETCHSECALIRDRGLSPGFFLLSVNEA